MTKDFKVFSDVGIKPV